MSKLPHLLLNKDLFDICKKEISKQAVREEDAIHTIFLCASGRLVENCDNTSYNILVNDESGIGKDYIVKCVLGLIPQEQWLHKTRISEKALAYWHNAKDEPNWTWNGKIFFNEDISDKILNSDVFKVFASSGSHAIIVINKKTEELNISGKPVMIITSAYANPNFENIRRFVAISLDSSEEQTKLIKAMQSKNAERGFSELYDKKMIDAQNSLKRVKVIIPFASKIEKYFPNTVMIRTHYNRFLDFIKASTALYQYQRDEHKDFYIATGQDYDIARIALMKTVSNPLMVTLTKEQQNVLNTMKEVGADKEYTIIELSNHVPLSIQYLYKLCDKLTEIKFLIRDTHHIPFSDKAVAHYRLNILSEIKIPTWEEIQNEINSN